MRVRFLFTTTLLASCGPTLDGAGTDADAMAAAYETRLAFPGQHMDLPEVLVGRTFTIEIPDLASDDVVSMPLQRIGRAVGVDSSGQRLIGNLPVAGAYHFVLSVNAGTNDAYDVMAHLFARDGAASVAWTSNPKTGWGPYATGHLDPLVAPLGFTSWWTQEDETEVRVHFPVVGSAMPDGTFPLLTLAHGMGYERSWYDDIAERLASWGIVVAVASFPDIANGSECTLGRERGRYALAAADALFTQSETDGSFFEGRLDRALLIAAGHSWGGAGTELTLPESSARLFFDWDPMSLYINTSAAEDCGLLTTSDPRVESHPIVSFDTEHNSFDGTPLLYRGAYAGPRANIFLDGSSHEDFLDDDLPSPSDDAHRAQFHDTVVTYTLAAIDRFLFDDPDAGAMLFAAPASFPPEYPHGVQLASQQPSAVDLMLFDGATGPMDGVASGSSFSSTTSGPPVLVRHTYTEPGTSTLFATAGYQMLHLQASASASFWLDVGGVDATAYESLQLDVERDLSSEITPLELVLTIEDTLGHARAFPLDALLPDAALKLWRPVTVTVPLAEAAAAGVDLASLARIEVAYVGSVPVHLALDDVRLSVW